MSRSGLKKSLYIFLCSLLGVLLFITLQHSILLLYVTLVVLQFGVTTPLDQLLAVNYATLVVCVFLGGWYGAWLGLYWYALVYESGSRKGFVHHLAQRLFTIANTQSGARASKLLGFQRNASVRSRPVKAITQSAHTVSKTIVVPIRHKTPRASARTKISITTIPSKTRSVRKKKSS